VERFKVPIWYLKFTGKHAVTNCDRISTFMKPSSWRFCNLWWT